MPLFILLFTAACFLAYSNGANDNFKGVATLFGSKTSNYRFAIRWATFTTFLGSLFSIYLAETLVHRFSGKGLVPDSVSASAEFLTAVAIGAGATVIIATFRGLPVSTTHGLTGALVGTGFMAVGTEVNFGMLGAKFFLPLLASPLLALILSLILYSVLKTCKERANISQEMCICVGETGQLIPVTEFAATFSADVITENGITMPSFSVGTQDACVRRYTGSFLGISIQKLMDEAHILSSGIVCFARGLNDTPKIVALLLIIPAFGIRYGLISVALGMAIGGLLNARRVAETMSKRITPMTRGQGLTANIVTGFLVVVASKLGMPVSTTHVSVGSIFGIGVISKQSNKRVISGILLSWLVTLPVAALLGGMSYVAITSIF